MGSIQRQASSSSGSGSDSDPRHTVIDEKKRKRMESNRESARRSRMRKQKRLEDLVCQLSELQKANGQLTMQINEVSQNYIEMESANNVLRAQMMELTERLGSLNSVLYVVGEASGVAVDIPEIPDPLLKPWQLPCPVPPIMASADMFQF